MTLEATPLQLYDGADPPLKGLQLFSVSDTRDNIYLSAPYGDGLVLEYSFSVHHHQFTEGENIDGYGDKISFSKGASDYLNRRRKYIMY